MLQFKRGLGFPTILNFAIYFLKKKRKVKIREYPQQAELAIHIQQMQIFDFFQVFRGMDLTFSMYANMQINLSLPANLSSRYHID